MTQFVTVDRATLEQLVAALEDSIDCARHEYETYWGHGLPTRKAQIDRMKESLDQHEASITAGRAALANAEPTQSKPYAWRNPMNGVVISNDKKERLLCVGRGYPNFSEPLYVAGAKP